MDHKEQHKPNQLRAFIYEFYPLIIVLIVVAVLFVGYMQIIDVQLQQYWLSKYHTLTTAQQQNKALAAALGDYQLVPPAAAAGDVKALADLALPENFNFSNLAVQLDALAENNGFKISSLENRAAVADQFTVSDPSLKGIDVTIKLKGGSYDNFKKLLKSLEASILYFNVSGISYAGDGYEIQLRTYYYQAP